MSATTNNTSPPKKQVSTSVPAFQFSVITCAYGIATKIFHADGKQVPYSNIKHFHFKCCEIDSLEDFSKLALAWLATETTRFIIRGQLKPGVDPTRKQRRLLYPKDDTPATIECPPRRWVVLDCDDVTVPTGLGSGSKLAEAGYFVRDNIPPSYFWGVRCVAAASPSTGRRGPTIARLRLFFILKEAADSDALYVWLSGLSQKF
jgi:hypothetical protein